MKKGWIAAALVFILVGFAGSPAHAGGDGVFTATVTPVAAIDKTGRPMTAEAQQSEPAFAAMTAGTLAGDSYIIHFSTSDAGGACAYTGTGRYIIESTGELTYQLIAQCGNLKRGYSYMVCRLDGSLRCSDAPWWYFRGRTYAVTNQGLIVNGAATYPWKDAAEAPQQLRTMAASFQAFRARYMNPADPHVVHMRMISCREFHPETKSYALHEMASTCAVKSMCDGIPNTDSLHDGDPVDLSSAVGDYIKRQVKASDFSSWSCWMRTQ